MQLFRRAVAYPDVGSPTLPLDETRWILHYAVQSRVSDERGGVESPYYEWFAETIRSVAQRLEALGIIDAAELDLPTLAARLSDEAVSRDGCLTTPLIVSCYGERS